MKALLEQTSTATVHRHFAVAESVLEELACRFREDGLFIMAIGADGDVAWHDVAADSFFLRYPLPVLRRPECRRGFDLASLLSAPASSCVSHQRLPGLVLAVIPHVERRHILGALLIVGDELLHADEDFLHVCGQLELDAPLFASSEESFPPATTFRSPGTPAWLQAACGTCFASTGFRRKFAAFPSNCPRLMRNLA